MLLSGTPAGDWTRVGPDGPLTAGQVLALPTDRAKIALTAAGVNLEILGPARIELVSNLQGLPGIRIFYGRVVLTPMAGENLPLRVALGDRVGTLALTDNDAIAALDVRRLRTPGTNPETGSTRIAADLYAAAGNITWEEAAGGKAAEPLQLAACATDGL